MSPYITLSTVTAGLTRHTKDFFFCSSGPVRGARVPGGYAVHGEKNDSCFKVQCRLDHVMVAFSALARSLRECSTIPRLCFFFFFFKVEISSLTLMPLFAAGSVHSGSASRDDCSRMFPDKLRVSCFLIGSHAMPGQRHNQLTPTLLGQGCMRV